MTLARKDAKSFWVAEVHGRFTYVVRFTTEYDCACYISNKLAFNFASDCSPRLVVLP